MLAPALKETPAPLSAGVDSRPFAEMVESCGHTSTLGLVPQTLLAASMRRVGPALLRDGLTQHAVTRIKRITGLRNVINGQCVRAAAASRAESGNAIARRAGGLILS